MKAAQIKGALLEYIIRQILKKCGFTNVKADGLYTFESRGLFFINGKGSAHDADILMNPPIQMPFGYPSQLIFECKAYGTITKLPIVRNALGLRNDINDFEIVTKSFIKARKNNRRASLAIENRNRYFFQVGVASVNDFTKPAEEFAINNKIPIFSLKWFLDQRSIEKFNTITDSEINNNYNEDEINNLYSFFKNRDGDLRTIEYGLARNLLQSNNKIAQIIEAVNERLRNAYIGLLETGDMFFLYKSGGVNLDDMENQNALTAELHWNNNRPNKWELYIHSSHNHNEISTLDFFLPSRLFNQWSQFNLDRGAALDMKQQFFSKFFIFNNQVNSNMPFTIIALDQHWLNQARERLNRENG